MKVFFSLVLLSSSLIFAEKLYSNLTEEEILRLDTISENIRCPKCDYGNINSSNAPISKDLKKEISYLIYLILLERKIKLSFPIQYLKGVILHHQNL